MKWFAIALMKYATFNGRAQRAEYWYFFLFVLMGYFVLVLAQEIVLNRSPKDSIIFLELAYLLPFVVPSMAVTTRRLHDVGKSGWWQLVSFVPLVGWIILLVLVFPAGQQGSNRYGPNPKEVAIE